LNKSYFTDRQDRYLLFSSAPELSNYCFDFLKTTSSFSYKLLPSSTPDDIGACAIPHWPHPSIHPHHIESRAKDSLSSLQRNYNMKSGDIQEQLQRDNSVVIFPVIQAGQFHIREEEECLRQLFYHLDPARSRDTTLDFHPLLNLTSGYFGLSKLYKNLILRSHVPTSIICASPEVRILSHLNASNSQLSSSSGEWILRFQGNIWSSSRGLHVARATIHGSRACFSTSRLWVRSQICGAQGVEQAGLDIPCKRCAHRFPTTC